MDIGYIYNYARWGHVLCMMLWIGGMIYLPLVMKAHAQMGTNEHMVKLERFLMRGMLNPTMILTIIFGIWLAAITKAGAPGTSSWIHVKILLVLVLAYFHMKLSKSRKQLQNGNFSGKVKLFDRISAISALIAVVVIYLATVKPF